MIVIGCAILNLSLRAMLSSNAKLEINAIASWTAFTTVSLHVISFYVAQCSHNHAYHVGSSTKTPSSSVWPGGMIILQCTTRAQILKAEAIGPKVPATKGNAVEANHHRLGARKACSSSSTSSSSSTYCCSAAADSAVMGSSKPGSFMFLWRRLHVLAIRRTSGLSPRRVSTTPDHLKSIPIYESKIVRRGMEVQKDGAKEVL